VCQQSWWVTWSERQYLPLINQCKFMVINSDPTDKDTVVQSDLVRATLKLLTSLIVFHATIDIPFAKIMLSRDVIR
jgi:hypothetical protein